MREFGRFRCGAFRHSGGMLAILGTLESLQWRFRLRESEPSGGENHPIVGMGCVGSSGLSMTSRLAPSACRAARDDLEPLRHQRPREAGLQCREGLEVAEVDAELHDGLGVTR
jgi:hypothetical protein